MGLAPLVETDGPRQTSLLDALESAPGPDAEPIQAGAVSPPADEPEPAPLSVTASATVTDEAP